MHIKLNDHTPALLMTFPTTPLISFVTEQGEHLLSFSGMCSKMANTDPGCVEKFDNWSTKWNRVVGMKEIGERTKGV